MLVKERITFSKRQLIRSSPDGCALVDLLVELGLDHLDGLRLLLQAADLHRLMIVHFCEPPWLIRYFQPALFLQTLEDRVHQIVPARRQIGQQFESIHEMSARSLRWSESPKHLRLL